MTSKQSVHQLSEFKSAPGGSPGEFTALVAVFNNVDLVGDRILPGAFAKSLDRWKASGNPIPVVWSHDAADPYAHIGYVTTAAETPKGLQVSGKNDVERNPLAAQVHTLLVERRVTGWSFRYDVISEKRARDGANELIELGLTEVGPTLKGANPDAQTVSAKALIDAAVRSAARGEIGADLEYLLKAVQKEHANVSQHLASYEFLDDPAAIHIKMLGKVVAIDLLEVIEELEPHVKGATEPTAREWAQIMKCHVDASRHFHQAHGLVSEAVGKSDAEDDALSLRIRIEQLKSRT